MTNKATILEKLESLIDDQELGIVERSVMVEARDEIERLTKALENIITAHCASDGNWKAASRIQAEMADAALGHPCGKPSPDEPSADPNV